MTDLASSPAPWAPPSSDPVISDPATANAASPPTWSPPSSDPVIGRSSPETPAWTPPDADAVAGQTLSKLDAGTVEDLAKDNSFRPVEVVSRFGSIVKPEQLDKLAEIERQKHENNVPLTTAAVAPVKGAWDTIKQLGFGIYQAGKHLPSVLRVAKTGFGGEVGHKLFGGEQTPEETAEDTKNAAEVLSAIEANAAGYGGIARGLVRNAVNQEIERKIAGFVGVPDAAFGPRVNADVTKPSTFFKPTDWKQRLLDDAAIAKQHQDIAEAGGQAMNLLGGKDELASQGITVNPEIVSQLSSVEDPTLVAQFALPMLRSLTVTGDAAKGFTIAAAGRTVATAATKDAADNFITKIGKTVAGTGNLVQKSAGGGKFVGAVLGHGGGPIVSGLSATALPVVVKGAGKLITWAGETLANPKVSVPVLEAGKRAVTGGVQGAAFSVPFAAGQDLPEDQLATLGAGFGLGAVGANAGHVLGKAKLQAVRGVEYAVSKAFTDAPDVRPTGTTPAYGTDAGLDQAHAQAMTNLQQQDPQTANLINRVRNLLAGDAEVYYVPRKEFSAVTGRPDDAALPVGVHIPAANGGVPKILIREGGTNSTFHEAGHVLTALMPTEARTSFYDAIKDNYSPEQLFEFKKEYQKSLGSGITDQQVIDEVGAELISGIIRGVPLDGTPLPIRQRALSIVGRLGESLGLYSPQSPSAPKTTGLDLGISPKAAKPAQDFVSSYLEGNTQPQSGKTPPVISTTIKPEVTPAHDKVLELLKSRVPAAEMDSWNAIRNKVDKGEELTPAESQDWSRLDDVAKAMPPEIVSAKPVEAPKSEDIEFKQDTGTEEPITSPESVQQELNVPAKEEIKPVVKPNESPNLRVTREQQNNFENRPKEPEVPERTDIGIQEAEAALKDASPEQKQIFETLRQALRAPQGQVKPVEILHGSVEPVEETPGGTRTKRRAEQEAQETRGDYQKLILPAAFNVTSKGKVQLRAHSPDKVLANAKQIVVDATTKKAEGLLPYEVKNGKLTPNAEKEFNADLEQYWVNQAAGFKGTGEPLIRPEGHGGFIPEENNQGQVKPISQAKVDFLNLVQGIAPPKTARVNVEPITKTPIKPVNVRAYELAKANNKEALKPGVIANKDINKQTYGPEYNNQAISEFNPLRKKLDEAGVPTRELLEATERLNLEDIKQAVPRPENRLRAPVTDVTAAGFLPERGTEAKELDPDWQVSVQKDPRFPQFGYVQIDDVTGGQNLWSKSPKTLREEGYNIPDSLFDEVPHGKYKLGDILNGEPKNIQKAQPQFQPVTTKAEKQTKGNEDVQRIASDYVREAGLPFFAHVGNQAINEPLAKRIASFYNDAAHEPTDPEVKKSYDAFVQETKDQYRHLTSEGYKMEPWTEEGQPYKNSAEMSADVRDNKHLWYFPTEGGFGTSEVAAHPLLDSSGVKVGGKDVPVNDLFRAVHDVFGHTAGGYEFGPRGELNAFLSHAAMYSEEARPAMAAETLGQNSWVNFGEHLRDDNGNIPKKGEKGFVPLTERPFAEHKATTLPKGMIDAVMHPENEPQFQPSKEPRAIKQAAIRDEEGNLFTGPMHLYAHMEAAKAGKQGPWTEGFVTNDGEFLNREQALNRAIEVKQYRPFTKGEKELESGALATQNRLRELGYDEGTDPLSQQFQPSRAINEKELRARGNEERGDLEEEFDRVWNARPKEALYEAMSDVIGDEEFRKAYQDAYGKTPSEFYSGGVTAFDPQTTVLFRKLRDMIARSNLTPNEKKLFTLLKRNYPELYHRAIVSGLTLGERLKAFALDKLKSLGLTDYGDLPLEDWRTYREDVWTQDPGLAAWIEKNIFPQKDFGPIAEEQVQFAPKRKTKTASTAPSDEEITPIKFHNINLAELQDKFGTRDINLSDIKTSTGSTKAEPKTKGLKPKIWMLPNEKIEQLSTNVHEDYLADNHEELNKRFGTKFDATPDQENRLPALNKGFVRIAYEANGGRLNIEANINRFTKGKRDKLFEFIADNLGKIDKISVSLLNDKGQTVKSDTRNLFTLPEEERLNNLPFISDAEGSGNEGIQFQPTRMTDAEYDAWLKETEKQEAGYNAIGHASKGSRIWIYDAANRTVKDADGLSKTHDEAFGRKADNTFKGRFDPQKNKVSVAFPVRELNKLDGEPTVEDIPHGVYSAVQRKYGDAVEFQAFLPMHDTKTGGTIPNEAIQSLAKPSTYATPVNAPQEERQ